MTRACSHKGLEAPVVADAQPRSPRGSAAPPVTLDFEVEGAGVAHLLRSKEGSAPPFVDTQQEATWRSIGGSCMSR